MGGVGEVGWEVEWEGRKEGGRGEGEEECLEEMMMLTKEGNTTRDQGSQLGPDTSPATPRKRRTNHKIRNINGEEMALILIPRRVEFIALLALFSHTTLL